VKTYGYSSIKFKNSLIITAIMLPLIVIFLVYDINRQSLAVKNALTERGVILARTGAAAAAKVLSDALKKGELTEEQLFDVNYQLIPGTEPPKYHTKYDRYTDANLPPIQDVYLEDKVVVYAVASDRNGYVPTHNTIVSRTGIGNNPQRTKRIFDDPVGIAASQNQEPYLLQVYRRDTGEVMWDISSPIFVNGRHWGAFRLGFSIEETERQIAAVRNRIIGGGVILIVVLLGAVLYISHLVTEPVKRLEMEAKRVAKGDFTAFDLEPGSSDEVGRLIFSFKEMVEKLRAVTEKTRHRAAQVSSTARELQESVRKSAQASSITIRRLSELSSAMDGAEKTSVMVLEGVEKTTASLDEIGAKFEDLTQRMKDSHLVVGKADEMIRELELEVEKVGDTVQFIVAVAEQASLMAERAAHSAPEGQAAGDSFVSLAREVQKRAHEAAVAAKYIGNLFNSLVGRAREAAGSLEEDCALVFKGFNAAKEAARSLKSITGELKDLARLTKEVAYYAQQVAVSSDELKNAVEEQEKVAGSFIEAAGVLQDAVAEMMETINSLKI